MTIGSGHPGNRDDALTPEERALADRLARLGPQGEPSPALDARILAAARAAASAPDATAATPSPRSRRRQRRWPVAFGAAATLVIVGGLAWQLRPVDELQVVYSEAPRAASGPAADAPPRPAQQARRVVAQPAAEAAPAPADSTASAPAVPMMESVPVPTGRSPDARNTVGAQPKAFASKAPAAEEPPVVFDEPSPMDTPPPPAELRQLASPAPPAPPPAPSPPASAMPAPAARAAAFPPQPVASSTPARPAVELEDKARAQRAKALETEPRRAPTAQVASGIATQPARQADTAAAADASALDRIEVGSARAWDDDRDGADDAGDQPLDDQPPASVDSPQVRQAWLQRVRQLIAEGRPDAARDSLREYQRRYPTAPLPDDLRALLGP